jgi:hypothetical protein
MVAGTEAEAPTATGVGAAAANPPPAYSVVPGAVASDRDTVAQLWQVSGLGSLSDEQQRARYDWFYLRNPQGDGEISFLRAGAAPDAVGFLGVGRRTWFFDGLASFAGVLVDFVVRLEHRTAAPALTLQRRGRERALNWAHALTGLPDVKAVPIFKRLDKHVQFFLPRYVRILRYDGYLKRRLPGPVATLGGALLGVCDGLLRSLRLLGTSLRGNWVTQFDKRFDDLWQRVGKQGRSLGLRDAAFLSWRFGQQPGFSYRTFAVERAGGDLAAYFVCDVKDDMVAVKDVLGAGSVEEYTQALLMLANAARREGAASVSIQVIGDEILDKALRASHFVEREKRPFFAVLGETSREQRAALCWYITQADEDI